MESVLSFFPGLQFLFSFTVVQLTSEVNSTPSIISYFVAHCVIIPARGHLLRQQALHIAKMSAAITIIHIAKKAAFFRSMSID